jgi:hypothetical protein
MIDFPDRAPPVHIDIVGFREILGIRVPLERVATHGTPAAPLAVFWIPHAIVEVGLRGGRGKNPSLAHWFLFSVHLRILKCHCHDEGVVPFSIGLDIVGTREVPIFTGNAWGGRLAEGKVKLDRIHFCFGHEINLISI